MTDTDIESLRTLIDVQFVAISTLQTLTDIQARQLCAVVNYAAALSYTSLTVTPAINDLPAVLDGIGDSLRAITGQQTCNCH